MNYEETVSWLYARTPQFERIGAAAYKPGLHTTRAIASALGNPERKLHVIHVAGTNGKGSVSHTIAAILQSTGLRVALYTSPHLIDFRERMRINGQMIPEKRVIDFVEHYQAMNLNLEPSFFELTTLMAFDWFASEHVDVAVIEVGLGGRLDSTNIVNPQLDIITNISKDHCAQLGNTLREITYEKCGIMRPGVTTVCGETNSEIKNYFTEEARLHNAPIVFADDIFRALTFRYNETSHLLEIYGTPYGTLYYQLTGDYQHENARTVLTAVEHLHKLGYDISDEAIRRGFAEVCTLTGLKGRWMQIATEPETICDTGHNIGGWKHLTNQLNSRMARPITMVLGFVADKDLTEILPLLPRDAIYIASQPESPRALPASELAEKLSDAGLYVHATVSGAHEAYRESRRITPTHGSIFIGGSTYIVADLLCSI